MAEPARVRVPVSEAVGRRLLPLGFPIAVAVGAAIVFGHGLGALPLWRDEAASVAIAVRPVASILAAAGRIDVVHTAYYLLLHPVLALGDNEALLRLPSLLGAVAAVVLTAELARRLLGVGPAAVTAALLVGSPWLAFYAREARPYALATALVCAAAFVLLGGPPTRRRLVAFTGLGVLATWVHLFDVLPVLGLLAARAVLARRQARGACPVTTSAVAVRSATWWVSAAALAVAAGPLALVAAAEAQQVSWVGEPSLADVRVLLRDATGSLGGEIAVAALLGLAAAASVWPRCRPLAHTSAGRHTVRDVCADRERCASADGAEADLAPASPVGVQADLAPRPYRTEGVVLVTALAGALAGPVVLLAVSWAGKPLYVERYVLATAPLLALAAAAAVRAIPGGTWVGTAAAGAGVRVISGGRRLRTVAAGAGVRGFSGGTWVRTVAAGLSVAAALTGVPAAFAGPADKTEDLRAAAARVAAAAQPGDCVAYDPSWARIGLDQYLDHTRVVLRDVAIDPGPAGRHPVGLFPAEQPLTAVEANLAGCARVWVAGYPGPAGRWRPVPEVTGTALVEVADRFTPSAPADFGDFRLTLWTAR